MTFYIKNHIHIMFHTFLNYVYLPSCVLLETVSSYSVKKWSLKLLLIGFLRANCHIERTLADGQKFLVEAVFAIKKSCF